MNIIIMREADATGRRATLTLGHLALVAVTLFVAMPATLGGLAFWLMSLRSRAAVADLPPSTTQQAEARAQQLQVLSRTELSSLAREIGRLTARTSRLDVLGARLSALAGIPPDVFRFPHTPPLGGEAPLKTQNWTVGGLENLSAQLRTTLTYKQMQLTALAAILAAHRVTASTTPGGWPVRGGWISSPFGPRPDPFTGRPGFHPGVDIAAPIGSAVRAMAAGVVIFAGNDGGFGRLVKIFDGHSEVTMYAHLSARYVHVGEVIHKGELLGRVGDTGYSTGPHLHFEVLLHGAPINPIRFLHLADRH
ncbi:MAG TPA: M23 family metallopeptidase [Acidiferrobacter sp.]|nr:M23 family metallopeptidase [Acidiferrobacter sp.]